MVNLIELMGENTQHIFTAKALAKFIANDGYMVDRRMIDGCMVSFEPCTLYKKKSMEPVPAFIVRKGVGPCTWTRELTLFALTSKGLPFIFTNGAWEHTAYVKSVSSNLARKFLNVHRSTMICVRNIKSGNPDRLTHDIFKVVEVTCDNS